MTPSDTLGWPQSSVLELAFGSHYLACRYINHRNRVAIQRTEVGFVLATSVLRLGKEGGCCLVSGDGGSTHNVETNSGTAFLDDQHTAMLIRPTKGHGGLTTDRDGLCSEGNAFINLKQTTLPLRIAHNTNGIQQVSLRSESAHQGVKSKARPALRVG